jgi:HlyD family secretion protein
MFAAICSVPLLAAFFEMCQPPPPLAVGYAEGEYVHVAPIETARIESLLVTRGDRVAPGDVLARMETRDAEIAVAEARAALARAESELADLRRGSRPEEIARVEAELASAKAQAEEARREVERDRDLLARGVLPQAQFDAAETRLRIAEARVAEIEATLEVMRLPARPDRIKAAEAAVEQARAALERAAWRLSQRELAASVTGQVTDILRFPGALAGPQAPVLTILPQGGVKLRFYVPEAALALIAEGTRVKGFCDGCAEPVLARVSYISDTPEFTPPVIYSVESRQKLVYLVEARPEPGQPAPKPGQILDIRLAGEE